MKVRSLLPAIVLAGAGVLVMVLASCSSLRRTVVVPPVVEGATVVGNKACVHCHADYTRVFPASPHARPHLEGAVAPEAAGCEAGHGPGSLHVQARRGR